MIHEIPDLDPRMLDREVVAEPMEELQEVPLSADNPEQTIKVGADLSQHNRDQVVSYLRAHQDIFAWRHEDMTGINPEIMCHRLNVDPKHPQEGKKGDL